MDLFAQPMAASASADTGDAAATPDPLRERLTQLDLDALSPREALALLYELRTLADEG
jgi:DNA mismatch repair protein MutS